MGCAFIFPVPQAAMFGVLSSRAMQEAIETPPSTNALPKIDESSRVYEELRKHLKQKGSIFAVKREEFLQAFQHGDVWREFAELVFDDWKQKKLKGMLREDPGF